MKRRSRNPLHKKTEKNEKFPLATTFHPQKSKKKQLYLTETTELFTNRTSRECLHVTKETLLNYF